MTYERFEDLPVWQAAAELFEHTDRLLAKAGSRLRPSFRDQIERAALSVSNNIAEGFERGTTNELLAFIYIARGSAGEVRSMLCLLERRPQFHDLQPDLAALKSLAESCSRQLRGWAGSLQDSDIGGVRHLNRKTREDFESRKRAEAFQKRLLGMLRPDHPLRRQKEEEGRE